MWYLNYKKHEYYAFMENAFNEYECDKIVELGNSIELKEATLTENSEINLDRRKNKVAWISPLNVGADHYWIWEKITEMVHHVNNKYWQYNIEYMESLQYTIYNSVDDFYVKHTDLGVNPLTYRKISFSLQLTDEDDYEGGDLLFYFSENPSKAIRTRGCITFFPSYVLHEVTPIISGKRESLVGWICGPKFK
jgi:PKHD-type hydroxylase